MSAPKNAPPVKTEPLPFTIKIPGGSATFCKKSELSPRRDRELQVLYSQLSGRKLKAIQHAQTVLLEGSDDTFTSDVLNGPDEVLTEAEARLLYSAAEVAAWAYLKSWTLKISHMEGTSSVSEPRPLPDSPDGFLDLPAPLYKAITDHSSKIVAQDIDDGFDVGSAGNQDSPITA
jgi:hypothetical protein